MKRPTCEDLDIAFKEHLVEEDDEGVVPVTTYHLEIIYNGTLTDIIIEAQQGPSMVEAWIGFRPIHWSSVGEHDRAKYTTVEGDIEDLKRWVVDNIDEVFEFCFGEIIYLQDRVDRCYRMLKSHLMGR